MIIGDKYIHEGEVVTICRPPSNCKITIVKYGAWVTRGSGSKFRVDRYELTPCTEPEHWLGIGIPSAGRKVEHDNGNRYTVVNIANDLTVRDSYPTTVIYQGENGGVWCKTLTEFKACMRPVTKEEMAIDELSEFLETVDMSSITANGKITLLAETLVKEGYTKK